MIDLPLKRDKLIEDEEWCKEIANDFVSKYIKLSDYKVYSSSAEGHYSGTYTYYREIDGYKTSECISVTVDGYGKICGFEAQSLSKFDNIKKVNCNENKLNDAIKNKLDEVYEDRDNSWTDFEITDVSVVKLNHRKYGFWCETKVYANDDYHLLTFLVK